MTLPELYAKKSIVHFDYVAQLYDKHLLSLDWDQTRNHSVLDIGTGAGNVLFHVLEPRLPANCTKVVGSDKSESMVNYCKNTNTSPRMEFVRIDIEAELLNNFKNSFDHLFSSYCFQYVVDLWTSFHNCFSMLKPGGDLMFIFATNNFVYDVYRRLSKVDKWFPYVKEFKDYKELFDDKNAEDVKKYFEECGFIVKSCEIENYKTTYTNASILTDIVESLDLIFAKIPEEEKENYRRDMRFAIENYKHWENVVDNNGDQINRLLFRSVIIVAQKPM